jgi:hypothetical protein
VVFSSTAMTKHISVSDHCCMCQRQNYSLRYMKNATGCCWVSLELIDPTKSVTWFVACAQCLCLWSLRFHASNGSALRGLPRRYWHGNMDQFYLKVENFIKDNLIGKAYIKGADGERTAVVKLRRELIIQELDDIRATREI